MGEAEVSEKCLGKMGDVANEGKTILFVSHNMNAIESLCSEAILLKQGSIIKHDDTKDVIGDYLNAALNSASGYFDCSNHPLRRTKNGAYIQSLTLYNSNRNQTNRFFPNSALYIKIKIESMKLLNEPRLAIAVEDDLGRRIFTSASFFQQKCEVSNIQWEMSYAKYEIAIRRGNIF